MEPNQFSYLFFDLFNGNLLAELSIQEKGVRLLRKLKQEVRLLSTDFGLREQDVAWVKLRPE